MKKILMLALLAVAVGACNEKKPAGPTTEDLSETVEELTRENEQLRNETDDLLSTLNEIEEGFREINEAQGRLTVDRRGEGANAQERIREDMQYIQETMAQNRELIEKLRARLRENGNTNQQLQRTLDNLTAQMEEKTAEIAQLRQELEAKNIRIDELDEQVATLNEDLSNLQEHSQQQEQTISQQDRRLFTGWYAIGTKKELKNASILSGGEVLQSTFDASYFTEVDIRDLNSIPLNYKSPEILTNHPANSYNLEKLSKTQYILHITDRDQFWRTSKYLVIQVK